MSPARTLLIALALAAGLSASVTLLPAAVDSLHPSTAAEQQPAAQRNPGGPRQAIPTTARRTRDARRDPPRPHARGVRTATPTVAY